jgi:hypothetical protein
MSRNDRAWADVLIFVTGGAVLGLELLASRVMTPYFGVSLFIWSGIRSITLAFLALGYFCGGQLAARRRVEDIAAAYVAAPVVAGFAVALAALVYPIVFDWLAVLDLVAGSSAGSTRLLAIPLIL